MAKTLNKVEQQLFQDFNPSTVSLSKFSQAIESAPLGVFDSNRSIYNLIPASITPLVLDDAAWTKLASDASLVLSAMEKILIWLKQTKNHGLATALFADLSELEKKAAKGQSDFGTGLATVRFDLFFEGEELKIIEVNTTIPAMQAYSDMVKSAFIDAWLSSLSLTQNIEAAPLSMQSNSLDLLTSLTEHYHRAGGRNSKPHIAIISRQGDSQLSELLWLQNKWREAGHNTVLAHPEDILISGDRLLVKDMPTDLTYRHIFANRLAPDSDFARACENPRLFKIYNPIAAHWEIKGLLAEVSRIASEKLDVVEANLTDSEVEAVNGRVPWSRIVRSGTSDTPDGGCKVDLLEWLKANQSRIVIKSSSGYGGHRVIIGSDFDNTETQLRVREITRASDPVSWTKFVDFCASSSTTRIWIAQDKVSGRKISNSYLANGIIEKHDTFIDCSMFSNSGVSFRPQGGACRFSSEAIVNIGRGGGLVPLLLKSEVDLLSALKRR